MLLDTRFIQALDIYPGQLTTWTFTGDVTRIWFERLDLRWRQPGFLLGGITGSDALFVLETLAQQQGRRVVSLERLTDADERRIVPVGWVIAPVHSSVTP